MRVLKRIRVLPNKPENTQLADAKHSVPHHTMASFSPLLAILVVVRSIYRAVAVEHDIE